MRLLRAWLAFDAALVIILAICPGRAEANAHPALRHGSADWY